MPTYFSFLTILAFHIFLEEKVDCAIIEVGIGGEYDPTNVVQHPIVCGITTLDYDHTNILGNTIESIAWSKAGIAKENTPLFTIKQESAEAMDVIKSRCSTIRCPLYVCQSIETSQDLELGIKGPVQYANASLACQIAKHFLRSKGCDFEPEKDVSPGQTLVTDLSKLPPFFREALEDCKWHGRCQILDYPRIKFFLDGAHTKKSMENCLEWFTSVSDKSSAAIRVLMVNVIGERDRNEVLRPLTKYKHFDLVLFSTNKIGSVVEDLDEFASLKILKNDKSMENVYSNAKIWDALNDGHGPKTMLMQSTSASLKILDKMSRLEDSRKYHVLVTGSLHFVGAVLETIPALDSLWK